MPGSVASTTDFDLFAKIMNTGGSALPKTEIDEIFNKMKKDAKTHNVKIEVIDSPKGKQPAPVPRLNVPSTTGLKPPSHFVTAPIPSSAKELPEKEWNYNTLKDVDRIEEEEEPDGMIEEEEEGEEEGDEEEETDQGEDDKIPNVFEERMRAKQQEQEKQQDSSASSSASTNPSYPSSGFDYNSPDADGEAENRNPTIRHEKQSILFKFRRNFPKEYPNFNMKMPLFELQYEYQQREDEAEEIQKVAFMKGVLKIVLNGIEKGNKKFGPFLYLDKWALSLTTDMSQFDHCLRGIYLQFFRKKKMSPVMELLWTIVGSMILWHITAGNQTPGVPLFTDTNNTSHIPTAGGLKPPHSAAPPVANGFNIGNILSMFS